MKTKLVLLGFLVVLAGCEDSDLDKARAAYACRDHGGVYYTHWSKRVRCNDGSSQRMPIVVPKEYWVKKESNNE